MRPQVKWIKCMNIVDLVVLSVKTGKVGNASAIANALREVSVKELGDADLNIWIWGCFFTKLISTEYISKCKLLSGETDTLTH